VQGVPYDLDDGRRGAEEQHMFEGFASLGIPMDTLDADPNPTELAPGVHFLQPGLHNQLVVEQAGGLVVIEAPRHPERSNLVLDWIGTRFPGRRITHTIVSHHHEDHSGGARAFAAQGSALVVGSDAAEFWRTVVLPAPSTVRPDTLSLTKVEPKLTSVGPAGELTLGDALRPIVVFPVQNGHSADMLLTLVRSGGQAFVFEADLFNTGQGSLVPNGPVDLIRALQGRQLVDAHCQALLPLTIVGGHGIAEPFEATLATMRATNVDLSSAGCEP
jgi:glyoxylase-like metal-dependent hydrolase (beta-lactamase superfamily II)